jgi:hypothetical protein
MGLKVWKAMGCSRARPSSRVAIASTDYVAADRVGLAVMGVDPAWVGYLRFCGDCGTGQYDLAKIEVRGEKIGAVRRNHKLHDNIQLEGEWLKPVGTLPRIG